MTSPSVSIVVPAFNAENTVRRTLNSVLDQTLRDLEVIAVDDASTDATSLELRRLAEQDRRVRLIQFPVNRGVHEARLEGIRASEADWVGFVDADDAVHPEMYRRMHDFCVLEKLDIAVCGIRRVDAAGKSVGDKLAFQADSVVDQMVFDGYCENAFGTGSVCNKLYRRGLFAEHELAVPIWRLDAAEDSFLNLCVFREARRIGLVADQLYDYLIRPGSATQRVTNAQAVTTILRALAAALDRIGRVDSHTAAGVTDHFRRLLEYDCYRVHDASNFSMDGARNAEALALLAADFPAQLAALVSRWPVAAPALHTRSFRSTISEIGALVALLPGALGAAIGRRIHSLARHV